MSERATEQDHEQSRRWGILFIVLPILGVLCLAILLFFQGRSHSTTSEFIPVNLHSQLEADYLANPHPIPIRGVSLDLIWDTLYDREPGATDLEDRQATLLNGLLTPVPTVTPSLSTCQGIHFIYADQDTWIESAHPTATHGSETLLQIGHDGNNTKRLLLHFPLEDIIPQNTLIHSARLEMDVEQTVGTASPESLVFFNLTSPFGEINTNWSNQPELNVQYQASELALGSIHVWDVTDIVRDWLESHSENEGIALEPQAPGDFTFVYYGREIISQVNSKPNSVAIPVGPRLVINCGGELPQAVAINLNTPTPTTTSSQPTPTRELANSPTTSTPLPTPALPLPTPAPLLPSPTVPLFTPTLAPLPTATQAPPTPTLAPPTNTPAPPPGNDDDDDGGGGTSPPRARADLALSITDSSDPVIAGNNFTYILTITNNGPNNATQVTITDALPPGVSLMSATVSQGTGCSGTSTVVCNLGSIANGNRATIIIVVAVNSSTTGVLTTSATVSANENDPALSNNSATETTLVISVADLRLIKTDSADPIVAGGSLTYTLTISNIGPSNATGVTLTDTLPISTMFVSASTGCMQSGGTITCSLGNLTAASSRQITVGVTVNPAVADGIVINNTAMASGAEPDPIPGNNTATEPTTINKVADLAISKTGTPNLVTAGQTLTYTLTVTNMGPSNASGVTLTDTLPAGVTFASASAGCANTGGAVTCTSGGLIVGSSFQRTIVVTVNASTTTDQINTIIVDGNETDPALSNNTDTITTTVQAETDLAISKADTPDPVVAGQLLTYTLTITNNGPSNATGVTLTDTLPPEVTFASASAGCTNTGGVVTCAVGNLSTGANLQRTIVVTVNASATSSLSNSSTIGGSESDPIPGNNTDTALTIVQTETDLTISKADNPNPVITGQTLTYTLTITNIGPSNATGVILTDTLPAGVTFASASAGCANAGGVVTCTIGNLSAGTSLQRTIVVTVNASTTANQVNTVTVGGNETDLIPGNNSDTITTTIQTETDLLISKTDTPDPVIAGQLLTYTLTITNLGSSDATDVILTDTLPAGVAFASASAGCANTGGTVTCTIGNLSVGASLQRTIVITINSGTTGSLSNSATVGGNENDPNGGNNTDTITTTVQTETDLIISKTDTPDPVIAGQLLTYTLTLTNAGPSDATGVVLTDTLPAGVTFASASAGCTNTGGVVTCTIGNLSTGANLQRTIVVTVNSGTTGSLSNSATVGGNENDPNGGNNSDTIITTVQTETDLIISKADTPDPVVAGQLLTYTLTITNNGPSNATGVTLTDTLPAGVTFASASAGCANAGGTVTCTVGGLAAGSSLQRSIIVTVSTTANQSNTVTVAGNETDPTLGNNTDTITTTVIGSANLGLTKQDSSDPVVPGSTFTYTVVAINNGPSNATNVSVSDTLPLSVTLVSSSTTQGTGCSGSGSVTCNLGTLATNAVATVTLVVTVDPAATTVLVNTASVTSTTTDPDLTDNMVTENTDVGVLAITKTSGAGGSLNPGQIFTYTLTVENIGSAVETNVTMSDTLPAGLSYVPGSTLIIAPVISTVRDEFNAISYNGNNGTVTWNAAWLEMGEATNPNGGQVQVVADARCAASNCVRIGGLNVLITGFGLRREADLSGARSALLTFSYRRQLLLLPSGSMSVEASNNGGGSWTNLKTYSLNGSDSAQIPQSFDITPYTASNTQLRFLGGGGLIASHFFADDMQIQYSKGITTMVGGPPPTLANGFTLMPGDVLTVTFQVQVDNPLTPTITAITNTASVTSDLQTTPLSDSVTDAIQQADLTLSKSDSPDPVIAGQTLTYTLSITNNGPSDAQNVVVTDTLPFSVTINTVVPPTSTQIGPNLGWNFGTLSNGATRNITLTVNINGGLSGVLANTAQITSTTTDPTPGNNTATATTTVSAPVDLAITKSDSPDPALVGQPISYTLQITNNGPGIATGVVVSDILPVGVTFGSATASQGSCSQAGGMVICNLASITSTGTALAQSTFDTNADGWRTTADATGNPTPGYSAIGGNPGGHISGVDGFTGISFYFEAPAKFLGNQSATYGGSLAFDLQRSVNVPDPPPRDDLFLIGGGLTLRTSIATPVTSWTSYTVPLVETNWINNATGLPPTQAQMLTVLSSLTTLRIMGEYSSDAGDSGYLDNVMLTTGPTTTTVTIVVTPSITGTIVNTATVNANEPDPNLSNNTATASTTIFEPSLLINDITVVEGDSGTTPAVFTVTLSAASSQIVAVNYTTSDSTATAGIDYIAASGTVTFPVGATVQTFTVQIQGDTLDEIDEAYTVTLSSPTNATIADGQGMGVITDDDITSQILTAMADAWLDTSNSNANSGTDTFLTNDDTAGNERRSVISFDLSSIPVSSTVLTATLQLYVTNPQAGQTLELYRVITNWTELEVTWNDRTTGTPWGAGGGDYDSGILWGSFNPNVAGTYQISLTTLAQDWVNGTSPNYGIILIATGANGISRLQSREGLPASQQPQLIVEYNELGSFGLSGPAAKAHLIYLPLIIKSDQANISPD